MFKLKQFFCEPEGLDTSTFFGDQGTVDESALPDASSPESMAMQPPVNDASDGKDPVDESAATIDDPTQTDGKPVPLGALQEERQKRQQAQDRNRELETQNNTLLERMNQILMLQQQQQQAAQQPQQQPQEEQIPEFIDDPVGHLEAVKAQFRRELAAMQQQMQGVNQHQQQQIQYNQMSARAQMQENEFRAVTPDYDAAVLHFRAVKIAEYAALGLNEEQQNAQLGRDSVGLAQYAIANNRNPAEVLYNLAKALRYAPADPAAAPQQPAATPPTSLSNLSGSGRAPDEKGKLTAQDIARMPQAEFDKLFDSMRGESVQRPAF